MTTRVMKLGFGSGADLIFNNFDGTFESLNVGAFMTYGGGHCSGVIVYTRPWEMVTIFGDLVSLTIPHDIIFIAEEDVLVKTYKLDVTLHKNERCYRTVRIRYNPTLSKPHWKALYAALFLQIRLEYVRKYKLARKQTIPFRLPTYGGGWGG
jgi:hypothetical protein